MSEFREPQKIKVVQLHELRPKQFLNIEPKNSPLGSQTDKNDPKIKSIKMSEFRESQKIKVVQLHEWRPKKLLINQKNSKAKIDGDIENLCCSAA